MTYFPSGAAPQYLDTTHSPVGLWTFEDQDLTDKSGNGYDLSLGAGTAVYGSVLPGIRGFLFNGSTYLTRAYTAALAITGDVTIQYVGTFDPASAGRPVSHVGDQGSETEANNFLYGVSVGLGAAIFTTENGSGTDSNYTLTTVGAQGFQPFHFAATRSSNVIQFYLNGLAAGAASSALTTPTGGTSGGVYLGAVLNGVSIVSPITGYLSSVKICNTALTAAQVLAEARRAMGF